MRASAAAIEWLRAYYRAVDGQRYDELAELVHAECCSRYPTGAVIRGRERFIELTRRSLDTLAGIRHELRDVWQSDHELIFELDVTFRRRDGQTIVRPGAGVFVLEDGKVREQRLYVDASGVWD